MYDPNDYEILETRFVNVIEDRKMRRDSEQWEYGQKKRTREEQQMMMQQRDYELLPYADFQKIILDFQLKEHEKFLDKFI